MCVLAVDVGASFIKGARAYPAEGLVEPSVRRLFPPFAAGDCPRSREVPLASILAATYAVIEELLRDAPAPRAIFLCGQMHGLVLVSPKGEPLSAFRSWQDMRSLDVASGESGSSFVALVAALGPPIVAQLGNELRPGFPLAQLHAMAVNGLLPSPAVPLSLPDYIALTLCNRVDRPATDITNAAAHGAVDVGNKTWHTEAIERARLSHLLWPVIVPTAAPLGTCEFDGHRITVHAPVGDQQAALLGAGLTDGELSLNIATGSQVAMLADRPDSGPWQLRPFLGRRWLRTITHLPAGRALNALVGLLGELAAHQGSPIQDPWNRIEQLAQECQNPHMKLNLAFFPSAFGDHGSIEQLTEAELHVGPLFRAAFRSMAMNFGEAARRVAPEGWSRLVFSGGLAHKSAVLREEIIAVLGSRHRMAPQSEDTLYGLMKIAGEATGMAATS